MQKQYIFINKDTELCLENGTNIFDILYIYIRVYKLFVLFSKYAGNTLCVLKRNGAFLKFLMVL